MLFLLNTRPLSLMSCEHETAPISTSLLIRFSLLRFPFGSFSPSSWMYTTRGPTLKIKKPEKYILAANYSTPYNQCLPGRFIVMGSGQQPVVRVLWSVNGPRTKEDAPDRIIRSGSRRECTNLSQTGHGPRSTSEVSTKIRHLPIAWFYGSIYPTNKFI